MCRLELSTTSIQTLWHELVLSSKLGRAAEVCWLRQWVEISNGLTQVFNVGWRFKLRIGIIIIHFTSIRIKICELFWSTFGSITIRYTHSQWEKLYTFRNSFVKVLYKLNRKFESKIHVVKLFPLNFASQKPLQFM